MRLLRHGADVVGVFGYEHSGNVTVSGWVDLSAVARRTQLTYTAFRSINDAETVASLRACKPDVLFVVGLSQLVGDELLSIPRLGAVGFHPTALPQGRGRAPLAWLVLDQCDGAATFFQIGKGIDDGPIFVQEPFQVTEDDDATTVEQKILTSIDRAIDSWAPTLLKGDWAPQPQDESRATWTGKRSHDDGVVEWSATMADIVRLVRATTLPHPGAFSPSDVGLVRIWEARRAAESRHRGVVGRVLEVDSQGSVLVQAGDGCVELTRYEIEDQPDSRLRVGHQLGYQPQAAFWAIEQRLARVEERS